MSNEINELLKKMDERMEKLDTRMDRQEQMMQQILQIVAQMDGKIDRVEESVNRIEHGQPTDTLAMLKQISGKLDERDDEIQVLNKRVFKTEAEIERLTRQ
jgi:uncharacterized coiled-coil protein SlyX